MLVCGATLSFLSAPNWQPLMLQPNIPEEPSLDRPQGSGCACTKPQADLETDSTLPSFCMSHSNVLAPLWDAINLSSGISYSTHWCSCLKKASLSKAAASKTHAVIALIITNKHLVNPSPLVSIEVYICAFHLLATETLPTHKEKQEIQACDALYCLYTHFFYDLEFEHDCSINE